jgi:hypothetical protein
MALARLSRLDHFFCHEQACPVVYFDAAGTRYDRSDLRVPVWQKEAPGDRVICYCFGDTEGDVRREIVLTGQCHAAARIRAHIAADRCACDIRNPKGVCCLGDLLEVIRRLGAPGTART